MDDAPLDRLNALMIVFDAMTNRGTEASINQFDEFEFEIHTVVSRLKKAGMWMRQITPLVAPSVRVLERMALLAQKCEQESSSIHPHGFRVLGKESSAFLAMIEAYERGETILFSDEMRQLTKNETPTSKGT